MLREELACLEARQEPDRSRRVFHREPFTQRAAFGEPARERQEVRVTRGLRTLVHLRDVRIYVGIALATNHIVALPLLAIPLWVLATKTIPYEEAMLEQTFGDEYRAYARRVRRWL